jgi:hypothetical protein
MFFVPNTTMTQRRGIITLPNGDEDNSGKVIALQIPTLLEETDVEVIDSETRSTVVVRRVRATVNGNTNIKKGDRLVDDQTGYYYDVDGIATTVRNSLINVPITLILSRSE